MEKSEGFVDVPINGKATDIPEKGDKKAKPQIYFVPFGKKGSAVPLSPGTDNLRKKGPPSRIILFLLIAFIVISAACCAVYTVVSMSYAGEKNGARKETLVLGPGQLVKPGGEAGREFKNANPNISFKVFIRDRKPYEAPSSKEPISEIFKEFGNREKIFDKGMKDVDGNMNETGDDSKAVSVTPKPRIFKSETWTIRRIPLDGRPPQVTVIKATSSPRGDASPFFPSPFPGLFSPDRLFPFDFFKKFGDERKSIEAQPKPAKSSSEEDKSTFPKSPMGDFKNIFNFVDKLFESKIKSDEQKETKPKTFVRIIPLTQFRIFPLHERPINKDVDIIPKPEKMALDQYKTEGQSEESNDFLHKFLGLTKAKHEKPSTPKPLTDKPSALSPLFQDWSDPFWPRLNVDLKPKNIKTYQFNAPKDSKNEERLSQELPETMTTEQPATQPATNDIITEASPTVTTASPKSHAKVLKILTAQ